MKHYKLLNVGDKIDCNDEEYTKDKWKRVGATHLTRVVDSMVPIRRLVMESQLGSSNMTVGAESLTNQKERKILRLRMDMISSLMEAVQKAHGCLSISTMMDMILEQLVESLAQNGIRFTYDKNDAYKS